MSIVFITEGLAFLGYNRQDIEKSLAEAKYDDVFATYLLLGRKSTDVSIILCSNFRILWYLIMVNKFLFLFIYSLNQMVRGQVHHFRFVISLVFHN